LTAINERERAGINAWKDVDVNTAYIYLDSTLGRAKARGYFGELEAWDAVLEELDPDFRPLP